MREDVRELVEAAQDDLDVAEKLFALSKHRHACFFAQQVAEKFFQGISFTQDG